MNLIQIIVAISVDWRVCVFARVVHILSVVGKAVIFCFKKNFHCNSFKPEKYSWYKQELWKYILKFEFEQWKWWTKELKLLTLSSSITADHLCWQRRNLLPSSYTIQLIRVSSDELVQVGVSFNKNWVCSTMRTNIPTLI